MSNLSKSLAISSTTVKKYISFMESAFLVRQLNPYSANVKKRLVKAPKIYIRDTGILHSLLAIGSFDALESNPALGNSWEAYVIEQITQRCDDNISVFFYRTQEGAECDLVLVKGGIPLAGIEIKYSSTPKVTKGMRISFDDLNTKSNYVIIPTGDDFSLTEEITACNLISFLENYLPNL